MKACEEPGAEMLLGRRMETETGSFLYTGFRLPPRGSSPAPLLLSRRCPRCLALEGAKAFPAPPPARTRPHIPQRGPVSLSEFYCWVDIVNKVLLVMIDIWGRR